MGLLTPHQHSALDYSRHIALTANAGSGKTFVLSKRYLQIALNEDIPLRNIAAITFTDKAAGELYKKISTEIDILTEAAKDPDVLHKLERIRRQLVSANISTIHSFCIDILREYPVEAQLDANFISIDQAASDELIEMSVEEIIKETLNDPSSEASTKSLIRLFSSKSRLASETASLIRNRKNVLEAAEIYKSSTEETADFFYEAFLKSAAVILLPRIELILPEIEQLNKEILHSGRNGNIAPDAAFLINKVSEEINFEDKLKLLLKLREHITIKEGSIKTQGYAGLIGTEVLKYNISGINEFLKELKCFDIPENHSDIEKELAVTGKSLISFFRKSLDRYESRKRSEGYLDYEDLLLYAKNLLHNENVQKSLTQKYKYLMVDEYQDTNEIQYSIFLPLLDYLKQNNLFVVGDEKQSIYMFRDAELEVFTRTKDDITKASGGSAAITLPDTFRMAPVLCAFTNSVFRNLFDSEDIFFNEVAHSDIICARGEDIPGSVEILAAAEDEDIEESDLVARRLLQLISESGNKCKWGNIAVLCRKRKSFQELEKAFITRGIPYTIIGGKGFYQRQAVYDVYNYFAFMLDDQNDAALAGILRSPFFNMPDSELFNISLDQGNSFWRKLVNYAGKNDKADSALKSIRENMLLSRNYDITPLLRKILSESAYYSVLASGAAGSQESANIKKLIRLTSGFFTNGYRTLYDYVNFLKDSIETEDDEPQANVSEESDSVKIMTVHQAKGLEYPVVLLYKSDETSRSAVPKSKEIIVDKKFGLLTKVPLNNDYFHPYQIPPVLNLSAFITFRKTVAEIKRLFYVAVTRAMDKLIISTVIPDRVKKDSFTGLLKRALDVDFTSPEYTFSSNLKYLKQNDDGFYNSEKTLEITIPLITSIEEGEKITGLSDKPAPEFIVNIDRIEDSQKGDIISATKFSVYKECPLKYNLIYRYGFSELNNLMRYELPDEETDPEDEEETGRRGKYADVKGTVIHKFLQQELNPAQLENRGEELILKELKDAVSDDKVKKQLAADIFNDLKGYFNSAIYERIRGIKGAKNEYNIYLQRDDYYLYGIIDKFIQENGRAVIIDYKTDNIPENAIEERSAKYFNQLKFYSYIIKSAFKNLADIELRIIYIKHPGKDISLKVSPEVISITGDEISRMVKEIRSGSFRKNYEHCRKCFFSVKNSQCIIN